jgi:hypothetical protein
METIELSVVVTEHSFPYETSIHRVSPGGFNYTRPVGSETILLEHIFHKEPEVFTDSISQWLQSYNTSRK